MFNLIPAFPMDGVSSRALHALIAHAHRRAARFTEVAAKVGPGLFAIGLGFLGLFGNPLLIFIAVFVYISAAAGAPGLRVREAMETRFTPISIDADAGSRPSPTALLAAAQNEFPVVDAFPEACRAFDSRGHPGGGRQARGGTSRQAS